MKLPKIFVFSLLLIVVGACSKEKESMVGFIMKVDGTEFRFETVTHAVRDSGISHDVIQLFADNTETPPAYVRVDIVSATRIKPGTYSSTDITGDPTVYLGYAPDGDRFSMFGSDFVTTNPVIMTITSLTKDRITGSFQGDLSKGGVVKKITDGQFSLPVNQ